MTNIKSIWFYVIVAASVSVGYGGAIATSPSQKDIERAVIQAQEAALRNCSSDSGGRHVFKRSEVQNTPGKGF